MWANQTFIELEDAIRELGGELTPDRQERFDKLLEARQRGAEKYRQALGTLAGLGSGETHRRPERKIGRNEPCWCGSGKKYKKCHLGR